MIIVQEMLNSIQADDVYEPPLLAEVGQYAELTQGWGVAYAEGFLVYYDAS
ncbi:MAG TPA: lasso RiPP family leader peptide-containing protein [Actinocrinis sp.]